MLNKYTFYLGAFAASVSSSVFTWIATENYWYNKRHFKQDMSGSPYITKSISNNPERIN